MCKIQQEQNFDRATPGSFSIEKRSGAFNKSDDKSKERLKSIPVSSVRVLNDGLQNSVES